MIDSDYKPLRRPEAVVREEPTGVALYLPDREAAYSLNPTAYAIWLLCDGETTAEEMAAAVTELTGLDPEQAMSEVTATLAELSRAELVK